MIYLLLIGTIGTVGALRAVAPITRRIPSVWWGPWWCHCEAVAGEARSGLVARQTAALASASMFVRLGLFR